MKKIFSLLIVCVLLVACGGSAKYDPENLMTDTEINSMFSNPDEYKGKSLRITGKIFVQPSKSGDETVLQIWEDPKNVANNFVVYANTEEEFNNDDFVVVEGIVDGTFEGTNALGGEVKAPKIKAETVTKSSYKEVTVNKSQTQKGVSLTVEKIEFAKEETRVYLKIKNNSKYKVNFYDFNSKAIIGSTQYGYEIMDYNADYAKVDSELSPKTESNGILLLKPITDYEGKKMKIIVSLYSSNYMSPLKDFNITTTIN